MHPPFSPMFVSIRFRQREFECWMSPLVFLPGAMIPIERFSPSTRLRHSSGKEPNRAF